MTRSAAPARRCLPDTICALATPPGIAGLAVVRVSGPDAFDILDRVFRGPKPSRQASHTLKLGWFLDQSGRPIDRVMLAAFRRPKSYTGEDMAEITCHGGMVIPDAILRALTDSGCRQARPGEFSRRAVLAGRMTLSQAEAVLELISARTRSAAEDALARYQGGVTRFVSRLDDRIKDVLAELELRLGIAETDSRAWRLDPRIRPILRDLDRTLARAETNRYLHDGARVAIVGRPNVGKSSLFNRLLGEDRAIVTSVPGTTRDRITGWTVLGNVPVQLNDTAGLGAPTSSAVTKLAARQTRQAMAQADLVLVVLDASQRLRQLDHAILEESRDRPRVLVINKTDRPRRLDQSDLGREAAAAVSCRTGAGISRLRLSIRRRLRPRAAEGTIAGRRQLDAARACRDALARSLEAPDLETAALEIRAAADMLSQVDSPISSDAILDRVFARFCVGK